MLPCHRPQPLSVFQQALAGCLLRHSVPLPSLAITGATSDSRQVRPGNLFCAIRGAQLDGHEFIPAALAAGATALVVESDPASLPFTLPHSLPWLQVRDGYEAAALVAEVAAGHPARALRLLTITGTNGKTTTSYLLRAIYQAAGHRPGMLGTVEYDLGDGAPQVADRTTPTPFQLQSLLQAMSRSSAQPVIMEISSHALAQKRLGTALAHAALFTNLSQDHLDYHPSMEQYYQTKKTLFSQLGVSDAIRVINLDDAYGQRLARELMYAGFTVTGFSQQNQPNANILVTDIESLPSGSHFSLVASDAGHLPSHPIRLFTPLPGSYNLTNAAGAAILALQDGVSAEAVAAGLNSCIGAPGRLQRVSEAQLPFQVFVDYAHTDDALRQVLNSLRQLCPSRLTVVFGCGGDRDRSKRPLMGLVASQIADQVIVTSDNPRSEDPASIIEQICAGIPTGVASVAITDRRQAIRWALSEAIPGAIILLAGKGHEEYQEINGVKHPFSDVTTTQKLLKELFPA